MQRDIRLLDPEFDRTHDADGDPAFQESSLIVWHDLNCGAGGVWRVSQEPVNKLTHSCFGVFTADGLRFRQNVQCVPMQPGDRGPAHMAIGTDLRLDLAEMSIKVDMADCQAELAFEDFHPRYDFLQLMNFNMPEGHGGQHLEMAGSVKGKIRIGTREFEIDALGHRDRSWGPRTWETLRSTRWWPMVFGPDLSIFLLSSVQGNGEHGCMGYVMRDGAPILMTEADVLAALDYDAIGPRAGRATFLLESGEAFELQHERSSGILLEVAGFCAVESVGKVKLGDRIGMSNMEVCTNPFGGTKFPGVILEADCSQGMSHANVRTIRHR